MERAHSVQQPKKWYLDQYSLTLLILDATCSPQPQDVQGPERFEATSPIEALLKQLREVFSAMQLYSDYRCESTQQLLSDISILLKPSYTQAQLDKEREEIERHMQFATPRELKSKRFEERIRKVYGLHRKVECMEANENSVRVHFSFTVASCEEGFRVVMKGPCSIVQEAKLKLAQIFKVELKNEEECNFFQRKPYSNYELRVRGFKKDLEEFPSRGVITQVLLDHDKKPLRIMKPFFDMAHSALLELYS